MDDFSCSPYQTGPIGLLQRTERHRLAALAGMCDPVSMEVLSIVSLPQGARCLEIGAGIGSIAQFILGTVGVNGHVVATDLDTSLLATARECGVEVIRHDLVNDQFPFESFDLIHARCVFEHIPEKERWSVLKKVTTWLKPGGWLVVEGVSLEPGLHSRNAIIRESVEAIHKLFTHHMQSDLLWTHELPDVIAGLGLTQCEATATPMLAGNGRAVDQTLKLTVRQCVPALLDMGLVDESLPERLERTLSGPLFTDFVFTLFSAWGRKAAMATDGEI